MHAYFAHAVTYMLRDACEDVTDTEGDVNKEVSHEINCGSLLFIAGLLSFHTCCEVIELQLLAQTLCSSNCHIRTESWGNV